MKNKIKKYRLKAWDAVEHHHFISKENWDKLVECAELTVTECAPVFPDTVLISPKGKDGMENTYMVDKSDLYVVKEKTVEKTPTPTELKPKTYTLDDIRKASVRAMKNEYIDNEDSAIVTALTLAKLINELN